MDEAGNAEQKVARHHTIYLDFDTKDKVTSTELMPESEFFTKGIAKLVTSSKQA